MISFLCGPYGWWSKTSSLIGAGDRREPHLSLWENVITGLRGGFNWSPNSLVASGEEPCEWDMSRLGQCGKQREDVGWLWEAGGLTQQWFVRLVGHKGRVWWTEGRSRCPNLEDTDAGTRSDEEQRDLWQIQSSITDYIYVPSILQSGTILLIKTVFLIQR